MDNIIQFFFGDFFINLNESIANGEVIYNEFIYLEFFIRAFILMITILSLFRVVNILIENTKNI